MSNQINKLLQSKLDQAGLAPYYSWNKSSDDKDKSGVAYPKILRLALMVRPEHYQSSEEKNEQTRYSTGDQITVFLHVTSDNDIQMIRYHTNLSKTGKVRRFISDFFPRLDDPEEGFEAIKRLKSLIASKNCDGLADFMIERLASLPDGEKENFTQKDTEVFKKAYTINYVAEAMEFFASKDWRYQAPEIVRNAAKVVVTSIFEAEVKRLLPWTSGDRDIFLSSLFDLAEAVGDVKIQRNPTVKNSISTSKLREVIPDFPVFVRQTIKEIIRAYKPQIMGWGEKKK